MKKGFVFIETIVVLVISITVMMGLYSIYSITNKNLENKDKYDNINDIYKIKTLLSLVNISSVSENYIIIDKDNCSSYMEEECNDLIEDLSVNQIIITNENVSDILNLNPSNISNEIKKYMKTLKNEQNYFILFVEDNNMKRYASLKMGEIPESTEGTYTFNYMPTAQTFVAPISTTYTLEAWGSQGGNTGGSGGYVKATVSLNAGETLTINTGGTDGTNGGGTTSGSGSYTGGGSTTIKKGASYLVIAAGGGAKGADGTAGGAGGDGNGAGGATVGAGAGNSGANGGGGSSSPTYTTQTCTYCSSWKWTGCSLTNTSVETDSTCQVSCAVGLGWTGCGSTSSYRVSVHSVSGYTTTGCSGQNKKCTTTYYTCTCSTDFLEYTSSCGAGTYGTCETWTPNNTFGKPGNGGTSSVGSGVTLVTKTNGVNAQNGYAIISNL